MPAKRDRRGLHVLLLVGCAACQTSESPRGATTLSASAAHAPSGRVVTADVMDAERASSSSRPASSMWPDTIQDAKGVGFPGLDGIAPATIASVRVRGDEDAAFVRSADGHAPRVVFLAGLCANASVYLHGFSNAARAHGGVLALEGDVPCPEAPGFRTLSHDVALQNARIQAAWVAAGGYADAPLGLTLIGYSLGATLAEELAFDSPERYARVVLIGSPKDPRVHLLNGVRAVATMSCALDVPSRMKEATRKLQSAGVTSRYFEMPGCTHGQLAEGDRVFGETFAWLAARP